MRCVLLLLAVFAFLPALSACSTPRPDSAWPGLMECPRPSPNLLRRVEPLPPIPTRQAQARPREPRDSSPQTKTSASGPSQPAPSSKPAAHA